MDVLGLIGSAAAGLWLIAAGALMALRPSFALHVLSLAASTRTINNVEQGLRLSAGVSLLLRAHSSKSPLAFEVTGWFIVVSSIALLVLPLGWHTAFACWWANRLTPAAVRTISPASLFAGLGLIYFAI